MVLPCCFLCLTLLKVTRVVSLMKDNIIFCRNCSGRFVSSLRILCIVYFGFVREAIIFFTQVGGLILKNSCNKYHSIHARVFHIFRWISQWFYEVDKQKFLNEYFTHYPFENSKILLAIYLPILLKDIFDERWRNELFLLNTFQFNSWKIRKKFKIFFLKCIWIHRRFFVSILLKKVWNISKNQQMHDWNDIKI